MRSNIFNDTKERKNFFIADPDGNLIQIIDVSKQNDICVNRNLDSIGIIGFAVGVHDVHKSIEDYKRTIGCDLKFFNGNETTYLKEISNKASIKYALLEKKNNTSLFSKLLTGCEIELLQSLSHDAVSIYNNRIWGDVGFTHFAFDVSSINDVKNFITKNQIDITIDSVNSFSDNKFSFIYISLDSTLVELNHIEHISVIKKPRLVLSTKWIYSWSLPKVIFKFIYIRNR